MQYNQFCPIAEATEILGEKWTILIVREILMGGCRFNEYNAVWAIFPRRC